MNPAASTIQIRRDDDSVATVEARQVTLDDFSDAVPWRKFRWYRKQKHYSGSYWSATMTALVGYESRLELANLLCEDFDPTSTWILSQPFLLEGPDGRRSRRHVPDYLVERAGGAPCVIDVKPTVFLDEPKVTASLTWSERVVTSMGWDFRVLSEPDPVRLANIRFLAGYRRAFQFHPAEVEAATNKLNGSMTIGQAVRAVGRCIGERDVARSIVLHLMWTGKLTTDLSEVMQSTTILEAGE